MVDNSLVASERATLSRAEIDQLQGTVLLEFGASWCSYCQAAQPAIADALDKFPQVQHIKIEDGTGQRLGRSYAVKLWPTLIFLYNGVELQRLVRPDTSTLIVEALSTLTASNA